MASEICNMPISLISFVGADKQYITSKLGSYLEEIDRDVSFCTHAIDELGLFEIKDTLLDPRFKHNPLVIDAPNIRYYAGLPLITPDGHSLGTLCVMDQQPRQLSSQQQSILRLLARDIISQLELRRQNFALTEVKELYELITETNKDLIIVKDRDFRICHANSSFLALYPEDTRDKVIGYTTLENYNQEEAEAFLQQDRLAFESGKSEITEKIVFPSGEIRTLLTTKTRFEDHQGQPFILGVSRDITEQEYLITQLQKSNQDLDEFAYIASHDLKAPLNAIKRLVSWIEEDSGDKFDEQSLKHFDMIKNRVSRMNMLLSDLLNYAAIGKDDGLPESINLKVIAENCYQLLDLPASFTIHVEDKDLVLPKLPLELILTNLMSNAVKHHDKKQGKIDICCEENHSHYQLTVADDGPGIDALSHKKIFEKFQTLKSRDEVEGSGLGLAMIQKAIGYYNGTISVRSELGQGTTFIVNWPK